MIKKRLIGVVTVQEGHAVQSFGYRRYLPLGRPEVLVENLDRWGVDEILLQCIDRSRRGAGPDFKVLERVSRKGIATPLIYSGGVCTVEHGINAVQAGADRICLDAVLHDNPRVAAALSEPLGAQALIAALPVSREAQGLAWLDYRSGVERPLSGDVLELMRTGAISEALLIDWRNEGTPGGFDFPLLAAWPLKDIPLIAFGGLSEAPQLRAVLDSRQVVAAAIGNFLSYREHAVQHYKQQLIGLPLRPAAHERSLVN